LGGINSWGIRFFAVFSILMCLACTEKNGLIQPSETTTPVTQPVIVDSVLWMGKMYHAVKIGDQIWMKENLDAGKYINSYFHLQSNNGIIEKYYLVDDSTKYANLGGLYTWDEAMQYDTTAGSRGICPPGWHIPTKEEFQTLIRNVNSNSNNLKDYGIGERDGIGNNSSGFSAFLCGSKITQGSWIGVGNNAYFWTSTNGNIENAWSVNFNGSSSWIAVGWAYKYAALNIRCIKNSAGWAKTPRDSLNGYK